MKAGRVMWLSTSEATATIECDLHSKEVLQKIGFTKGFFLTEPELLEMRRQMFEAARQTRSADPRSYKYQTFEDYIKQELDEKIIY